MNKNNLIAVALLTFTGWLCYAAARHLKQLDKRNEFRREHARRKAQYEPMTDEEWKELKEEIPHALQRGGAYSPFEGN